MTCEIGLIDKRIRLKRPKEEFDPAFFENDYIVHPNNEWLDVDCHILATSALDDVLAVKSLD